VPAGSDAYSLGYILHDWSDDAGALILDKVAAASRPGGLLVIGEAVWNDDRTGPLWVAQSDMNMLVAAYGRERSVAEYGSWIGEHGFALERVHPTSRGKVFLLARRRQDRAAD
jgi:hypothetical protein